MANTKISALTAGAPALASDLLPIDRSGANYSLQVSDVLGAISSLPNGTTATTQAALDGSTKVATDAYADAAVAVEVARAESAESLLAPKASPAFTGSPTITGGLATVQLATPSAPVITQGGTPATTDYTYKVVAKDANGGGSIASSGTQTTAGAATLNSTNYNTVSWTAVLGAASYDVYRTASAGTPSTTGFIGNTASLTFNDTGIAATQAASVGATAPTVNTSGTIKQTGVNNGGGYFVSGNIGISTAGTGAIGNANAVGVLQFTLPVGMLIGHCTVVNATAQSAQTATLGIYDVNGNKLIDTGTFSLTSGAPTALTNSFTQVYLPAGTYFFAWSNTTSNAVCLDVFTNFGPWQTLFENANTVKLGTAGNSASSGVLPQTLGTITKAALNVPICVWES